MSAKTPRLFDPDDYGPRARKEARRPHLEAVAGPSEQMRLSRDGGGLVPGVTDGLPVRLVKPHSAQKSRTVSRDLGTVGRAMNRKWFEVHYLELFCGPGYLLDETTREELPGSPFQALGIASPFDRYVFSDFSEPCTDALCSRIASLRAKQPGMPPTDVRCGDANDPAHLELVCSLLSPRALVIAYLDPAKPNLHFSTVRYLAQRFQFLDLIINLPFSGIHRSLAAGGDEGPRLMLNHDNPFELLDREEGRTAQNIRDHYDEQLRGLGLVHIARRCVKTTLTNSPLYDVVLASRKDTAVKLFEKANPLPKNPQLGLGFDNHG
jgi:three-Cys-motif partner protein